MIMYKKNIGLLHGFLFAICVIVMVYSGDQVKSNTIGISSHLMKCSALISSFGIISLGFSFFPASKSQINQKLNEEMQQNVLDLYKYKEDIIYEMEIRTVQKIEVLARCIGYNCASQDYNNKWNWRFTYFSLFSVMISSLLFGVGIFLL